MIFTASTLAGAYTVDPTRIEDDRGFFARTFSASEFAARGLPTEMPECSTSFNARKGTLRGLHFQAAPHAEDKLVRCTAGAIFDVIVDLRAGSPSERRWFGAELTADNRRSLFVPKGCAHGFITLADETEVLYMITVPYVLGFDRGVRWNDPALDIRWPIEPVVISARDAALPLLGAATAV
jgi:dTDP-4-dehydrorhamnose 3,5-epimerase